MSPDNLDLPSAIVEDGVLAPSAQAFKAFVVRTTDNLTKGGVVMLAQFAQAGLPIIFYGGIPSTIFSWNTTEAQYISTTMNELAQLDNVHIVQSDLAQSLLSLGIEPFARITGNGSWYTNWHQDTETGSDYVYIYNSNMTTTTGSVEFQSVGVPYWFDAVTGEQTPVVLYNSTESSTTIPLTLAGDQSMIVVFTSQPLGPLPSLHFNSVLAQDTAVDLSAAGDDLVVKAGYGSSITVSTSDGQEHSITGSSSPPFELQQWSLIVEQWAPSQDLYESQFMTVKTNSSYEMDELVSWQSIEGLEDVSGRGYYNSSFQWPPTNGADGATIDFGRIFHTLQAAVNGQPLPSLDVADARADITQQLRNGTNTVEVCIATTLINVVRPFWNQLESSGSHPRNSQVPDGQDYGLQSPVIVTPYQITLLQ